MVTLSGVREWDVTHLEDAASHWRITAGTWADSFHRLHRMSYVAGGDDFSGQAADALIESTAVRAQRVASNAMDLVAAAKVADRGAEEISYAKDTVLNAVRDIEDDGFTVGEDWSLTDRQPSVDPVESAARLSKAEQYQGSLTARVANLLTTDEQVSGQVGSIRLVDFDVPLSPPPPQPVIRDPMAPGNNPLPFATPRPPGQPPTSVLDPVNDFYKQIAAGSNQIAANEPCPPVPQPEPSNWDKITTPGPGFTDEDLQDKWLMYVGSVAVTAATLPTDPFIGLASGMLVKPSFDDLLKAYGVAP